MQFKHGIHPTYLVIFFHKIKNKLFFIQVKILFDSKSRRHDPKLEN